MKVKYNPQEIEKKWQKVWEERKVFKANRRGGKNYYVLEMFPYPSGRIHMGHVRNYVIGDLIARAKWLQGYNVLHPMGWDAFGLPAENAAIEHGIHPATWTYSNIENMKRQLKRMGLSYDWDREITTCKPEYYKWEQTLFIKLLEKGVAYKKTAIVNWCPNDNTVLANEQVKDGVCERCRTPVVTKEIPSWYLKITDYAERLLAGLEQLKEGWPERVIAAQKQWIGKSKGVEIDFPLEEPVEDVTCITVFTTRQDTIFGVTFISIAAEHPLALKLAKGTDREEEVERFVQRVRCEDKAKRTSEDYEKEGVFTGKYCLNPITGDRLPIYIANFVVMEYGTGAVMAVPAHDQRDFLFAKKYKLPIRVVIQPENLKDPLVPEKMEQAYTGEGIQVNSGEFTGLHNREALEKIADFLEAKGIGRRAVNYRLKDWLISRQRYWGCPIPVVYCERCGIVPEKEENLPVVLPEDIEITGKGGSPLANHPKFINTTCPKCGSPAKRESDTFDTFVESSWYYLRYITPNYDKGMVDKEEAKKWLPVDQYIGGIEHAVGHLLYARFFHKLLLDLGIIEGDDEPFKKLLTQGMVIKETQRCVEHGWLYPEEVTPDLKCKKCGREVIIGRAEKMSKSLHNIVDPEEIIEKYGADTARFFILSDSPPDKDLLWSDRGVEGCYNFLEKLWTLLLDGKIDIEDINYDEEKLTDSDKKLLQKLNQVIDNFTKELEDKFRFNTVIARFRELVSLLKEEMQTGKLTPQVLNKSVRELLILLNPIVPHITEELWEKLGGKGQIVDASWPRAEERWLKRAIFTLAVQVNGKLRATLEIPVDLDEDQIKELATSHPKVLPHIKGKLVKNIIYVPGRIVNIVVK